MALLSTWAWTCCRLPPRLPPSYFPGSNTLGKLRQCLESLDCSSSATRQIRSWSTFNRKAALCFLLMLLPLPLFPNRYVNTCIFLFKLSELVLCLCLDLAIGLSLAPPFLTRIGATGIWSSNFQTAAGLRPPVVSGTSSHPAAWGDHCFFRGFAWILFLQADDSHHFDYKLLNSHVNFVYFIYHSNEYLY